jgi:uncharacterized protein (TIGR03435 family)
MDSARFDIDAKIPAGAGKGQVSRMLQALLAERFHLAAHRETKDLPVYALVVGKRGLKLKESPAADPNATASPDAPSLIKGPDGLPEVSPGTDVPRSYEVVLGGSDGILYKLWARRETMQQLADRLSGQLDRAVVDKTGLRAQYDFSLVWTMESVGGLVPRTDPPPDQIEQRNGPVMSDPGLSIFTAVQAQLGLRLEQRRAPLEMLIVESLDKTPTVN